MLKICFGIFVLSLGLTAHGAPSVPAPRDIAEKPQTEKSQESLEASLAELDKNPEALKEKGTAVKPADNIPESQIPVFKSGAPKKAEATSDPVTRMSLGAGVVLFLLGGTFLFIKRWKKKGAVKKDGTEIKVVSQHHLGPKKSLAVVRVAGEAMLIGVTDMNITLIKALTILDEEYAQETGMNFDQSLGRAQTQEEADDFAVRGVRDIVSDRLRSMRNLV